MEKNKIIELLGEYNKVDVEKYASYIMRLYLHKKDGVPKNEWIQKKKEPEMATLFKRVHCEGLVFDGVDITLQNTGISYGYQSYKNKMIIAYPETLFDSNLVFEWDVIEFSKVNWKVIYSHTLDPFNQNDSKVIWAYAVIKNKRGESLTTLTRQDIDKHRKVAKTDFIWRDWFQEMCLKTIVKKACKKHSKDIYNNIEEEDNKQYDLEKVRLPNKWWEDDFKAESIKYWESEELDWIYNKYVWKEWDIEFKEWYDKIYSLNKELYGK